MLGSAEGFGLLTPLLSLLLSCAFVLNAELKLLRRSSKAVSFEFAGNCLGGLGRFGFMTGAPGGCGTVVGLGGSLGT